MSNPFTGFRRWLAFLLLLGAMAAGLGAGAQSSQTAPAPRPIWAGTYTELPGADAGGVYRSIDGAEHWLPASKGLPADSLVWALTANGQIAYALMSPAACPGKVRGIYRTADGGTSWTKKSARLPRGVGPIAVDPAHPLVVFASLGALPSCGRAYQPYGFFRSRDGGEHWQRLSRSFQGLHYRTDTVFSTIVINPRDPSVIYGGLTACAKSTDGGRTWNEIPRPPGLSCSVLAIDPRHPETLYAGSEGGGVVYRTADAGRTWVRLSKGLPSLGSARVKGLAVDAQTGVVYAAVVVGLRAYVYKSTNGGRTWTGKRIGAGFSSLSVDPAAAGSAYVGTDAGVLKTSNAGASWVPKNNGLPRDDVGQIRRWRWSTESDSTGWSFSLVFGRSVARSGEGGNVVGGGPLQVQALSANVTCGDPREPRISVSARTRAASNLLFRVDVASSGAFSYSGQSLIESTYERHTGTLTLSGQFAPGEIRGTIRITGQGPSATEAGCPAQLDSGPRSFVAPCYSECDPPPEGRLTRITALTVG